MPGALIIQVPRDGPLDRQLGQAPPPSLAGTEVVVERLVADAEGALDAPHGAEVVMTVPSPASLAREPAEVRRVIERAGSGVEPLVIVVEVAEELHDDELAPVIAAAGHATRPVILRITRGP